MTTNLIPYLLLGVFILAFSAFIYAHWRYHPQETDIESFETLQKRLRQGKPTLLQFHAPL